MTEVKIPEGYKQTEIGIIPGDWEVFNFGSLINYIKGCPFKSADYQHTGVRIIRVSDTSFTEIKDNNPIYISDSKAKTYKPWKLQKDDLIISTVGSKPPMYDSLVGKVIKVTSKHDGSLLNQNALRVRAKSDTNGIQSLLLGHFRTERYIDFIERIYRGNANQASITLQSLFEFKIPLPESKKEQTAIATALSDIDDLIGSLEKLTAKKEAIKTGTMQQLLTGKTRLPEFATREDGNAKGFKQSELGLIPEDWDLVSVDACSSKVGSGKTPTGGSSVYVTSGRPFIRSQNVGWGELKLSDVAYITNEVHQTFLGSEIESSDVLLNITGASIGRCTKADARIAGGNVNQHVCIVRTNQNKLNPKILVELINSDIGQKQIDSYQAGGNREGLNFKQVRQLKFAISDDINEQTAIATILSDMDNEIQALQKRLDKTRDIKQGMMQQLLTGKVRLAH